MPIRKATSAPAPTGSDYTAPEESLWENENPEETSDHPVPSGQQGWGALQSAMEERAKAPRKGAGFQFTDTARPVLFLSDGPVKVFERHWLQTPVEGRNSYTCAATPGGPACPLCATGNRPSLRADFQVLDLEFVGDEIVESPKIMNLGIQAFEQLLAINADERKGPLQGHWFAVYTTGVRPKITHHFEWIKERDLEEDWGIPLDGAKQFAEQYVGKVEYKNYEANVEELRKVAAQIKKAQ